MDPHHHPNIRDLGGLSEPEIQRLFERLEQRLTAVERAVCPNGRPGLEDRMREHVSAQMDKLRTYVDERVGHAKNSSAQGDVNMLTMIQTNTQRLDRYEEKQERIRKDDEDRQDERHKENIEARKEQDKKLDKHAQYIYMGIGGIFVLEIVLKLIH